MKALAAGLLLLALGQDVAPHVKQARAALTAVAEANAEIEVLRASFRQEQESLLLDEPIVTEGTLYLRKDPGTVVLHVDGERHVRLRSDATTHRVHHPGRARAEVWTFETNELATALLACFGGDVSSLGEVFEIEGCTEEVAYVTPGEEPVLRQHTITMRAKDEEVAKYVRDLTLVVDSLARHVVEVQHAGSDGEAVRLTLSKIETDPEDLATPEARGAVFDAPLPEGTDVRRHRVARPKAE